MNLAEFKSLSPEQKKRLILIALSGMIAVYAVFALGVAPFLEGTRTAAAELDLLRDKLGRAEQLIDREAAIRAKVKELDQEFRETLKASVPPLDNSLSWVAGRVYSSAREVGVQIESVTDLGVSSVPWTRERGTETKRVFVPYKVRVVTSCGYHQLVELIEKLEEANPYICVSDVLIEAQPATVERHRIRISVEWPYWIHREAATDFLASGGQRDG